MRFTRVKGYIRKIRREKTEPSITGIDKNITIVDDEEESDDWRYFFSQ